MSKLIQCGKQLALTNIGGRSVNSAIRISAAANNTAASVNSHPIYSALATSTTSNNSIHGNRSFCSYPPPGDSSREPFIPPYQQKEGESLDTLRARLLYQSRKRGMLENGLLLSTFAAKYLESMTEVELKDYDRLINLPSNDWDIYYWATGVKPIPCEFDTKIMHKFIDHVRNTNRESRIRQPDLY